MANAPLHRRSTAAQTGFSLIELMVVLAIISIVALIAVPSYESISRNNNITAATNNLMGALQLARSEAVTRHMRVTVCPSNNGASCTGGASWNNGGVVRLSTAGTVLRVIPPSENGVTVTGNQIEYRGDGTIQTSESVVITHPEGGAKTVQVNLVGQGKTCNGDHC